MSWRNCRHPFTSRPWLPADRCGWYIDALSVICYRRQLEEIHS